MTGGGISLDDYLGPRRDHPEATPEIRNAATGLLAKINALLLRARYEIGWEYPIDKDTGTCVSGSKGNSGDGGLRVSTSKTGRPGSPHRKGRGCDVFDPDEELDDWLTDELLAEHDLYREHPDDTPGWCHLQDLAPGSGRRTFKP